MSNCFIRAAAVVMNVPVPKLLEQIGHDGKQIIFPNCHYPYCCRGFHEQEIIDIAITNGYMVTPIENQPVLAPVYGDDPAFPIPGNRVSKYLVFDGILCGTNDSRSHAVAWVDGKIIDNDKTYDLQDFEFNINQFLIFSKVDIDGKIKLANDQ